MSRRYRRKSFYRRKSNSRHTSYHRKSDKGAKSALAFALFALPFGAIVLYGIISVIGMISDFLSDNTWFLVVAIISISTVLGLLIFKKLLDKSYTRFILNHSTALKDLFAINDRYTFADIPDFDMDQSYDNENFYNDIKPIDYLTYQLVYTSGKVRLAISDAEKNSELFSVYKKLVNNISCFDKYDTEKTPRLAGKRQRMERKLFDENIKKPITSVSITVSLKLTNIQGRYITHKKQLFNETEINELIDKLKYKNGDFYLDPSIWDSICRVERGKVTNKIRFAVYSRDGNRCKRCGSRENLEVDHIFPIAKGGKSNFDNLQTLCHRCNALKSDRIEAGAVDPRRATRTSTDNNCPYCKLPLVLRNGRNGKFYGCQNYPECKYTKNF